MAGRTIDPYRVFFPIGLACAAWGAIVWWPYAAGRGAYPGLAHAELMVGGFLLAFTSGFLLTAVPRFTGTEHVSSRELAVAVACLGVFVVAQAGAFGESGRRLVSLASVSAGLFVLAFVGGRRLARRKNDPPAGFAFAGLAVLSGAVSAAVLAVGERASLPAPLVLGAHRLLFLGVVPALVLGVGSRLVPSLMGHGSTVSIGEKPAGATLQEMVPLALLFLGSFALDAVTQGRAGPLVRAMVATWIAVRWWKVIHVPPRPGMQSKSLWVAAWTFLAGLWLAGAFPTHATHALHLTFVGGLGLVTLLVATRVTLSHGGYGAALETTSRALGATAVLALLAAIVRASALLAPGAYLAHLSIAATLWFAAVVVWAIAFVPRVVRVAGPPPH